MDSRGVSRDGAVNRLMGTDQDQIEIEIEGPPSPGDLRSPYHRHSRGPSESTNLLQSRARGLSESQNLLSGVSKNLFEYSSTRELTGYVYDRPEPTGPSRADDPVWAGVPQTLRRYRKEKWLLLLVDILAFSSGFPFFALAGYLIWLNGKQVEDHQLYVLEQCTKGASTLLPLVFSVIIGRAIVKIASWKLERGTSLGLMEQLMGSRTVGGTLITFSRLRAWKLVSIALIFLWLLSPVGSQAALRMLSTTPVTDPAPQLLSLSHFNTRQPSYVGFTVYDSWFSAFASLFSAALFSPEKVKASSQDMWGNVKIPLFSSLANVSQDANGWKVVAQDSTPIFSSLFGIPITGTTTGNTTFNVESSYMELSCANRTSDITRSNDTFFDPGLIAPNGIFQSAQTVTSSSTWVMGYVGDDLTSLLPNSSIRNIDSLPSNTTSQTFLPGLLLYQDFTGANNVTSIFCTPSQAYVESTIACTESSASSPPLCAVTAQRLSLLPHMPTTITLFSFIDTFLNTSLQFPNSEPQINNIDPIQNYIVNPSSNSFIQSTTFPSVTGGESRFMNISLDNFGTRLSQVMNAFLQGTTANSTAFLTDPASAFGSLPSIGTANTPALLTSQIGALSPSLTIPANTTAPPITPQPLLYTLSYPWLTLFLLSSLLIPLSALLSAILARQTVARDYLGSVSSIVRESQYINFPPGGASLDGMQRSREMQGMRIQLGDQGDVAGGFSVGTGVTIDVGVLALGEEKGTRALDRRKLYL